MWLFVSGGFVSIVAHRTRSEDVLVRARHPEHINALFPRVEIVHLSTADYPYRVTLPRGEVGAVIAGYVMDMGYDNFKNSIHDVHYHDVCLDVWGTMWTYGSEHRYRGGL